MEVRIHERTFWTDSKTVIEWLKNDLRRYTSYVSHRLAEIDESSNLKEWRWIPSKENPADSATKETKLELNNESRWFRGPSFLSKPKKHWPHQPIHGEFTGITVEFAGTPLIEINRFSSWLRLVRTTVRVMQFVYTCKRERKTNQELTALAEEHLIRQVQRETYKEEIACIKQKKTCRKR